MIRLTAMIVLVLTTFQVNALEVNEWTMDLNTGSFHSSPTYASNKFYNEDNNGFGFTHGYSDMLDFKVGYVENSYNRSSFYGGFVLNKDFYFFNRNLVVSPGMGLFVASGYDDTPMDTALLTPVLHPSISIGHKYIRSTIGYLPYDTDKVLTFQTQIMF